MNNRNKEKYKIATTSALIAVVVFILLDYIFSDSIDIVNALIFFVVFWLTYVYVEGKRVIGSQ